MSQSDSTPSILPDIVTRQPISFDHPVVRATDGHTAIPADGPAGYEYVVPLPRASGR